MPRGDKDAYTDKQKRKAEHIEEGYEDRGVPKNEAERRAWATVNKESGGGKKSGSGRGKPGNHASSSRGGRAHKSGSAEQRSAAARKG
jgi:plasmid stabilization system protein ParE